MFIDALLLVTLAGTRVSAEAWRWPGEDTAASVQIDTKVRFFDDESTRHSNRPAQEEELSPFSPASDTEGFYNRPGSAGRYRVRVETPDRYRVDPDSIYPVNRGNARNDGTVDSLQHCKCVTKRDCSPRHDSQKVCGPGKSLCCYNRPKPHNSEYFNEIEDQRNLLHPGRGGEGGGAFAPPQHDYHGYFAHRPGHDTVLLGNIGHVGDVGPAGPAATTGPNLLVGPEGPTGAIGPHRPSQGVLVGPGGPTGSIGPNSHFLPKQDILVGPSGATGVVGPQHNPKDNFIPNKGILVGPEGPSGQIGPNNDEYPRDVLVGPEGPTGTIGPSASAQRGVLVGPGGPTGFIGPRQYSSSLGVLAGPRGPTGIIGPQRRPVLVGPGGPTGFIGPAGYRGQRNQRPGLLVGPGGPTGSIGPGRPLLVGPGGPTGTIGPTQYGCSRRKKKPDGNTTPMCSKNKQM